MTEPTDTDDNEPEQAADAEQSDDQADDEPVYRDDGDTEDNQDDA